MLSTSATRARASEGDAARHFIEFEELAEVPLSFGEAERRGTNGRGGERTSRRIRDAYLRQGPQVGRNLEWEESQKIRK